MANVKFNTNQKIGKQELDRAFKYAKEEGFVRQVLALSDNNMGVLDLPSDAQFDYLRPSIDGSYKIGVKAGKAIDGSGNWIEVESDLTNLFTHSDTVGTTYLLKIAYTTTEVEEGTVALAANGTLTGTNTKFTEFARAQGNTPIKIKFPDSVNNIGEYEVISISSDTSMVVNPIYPGGGSSVLVVETGKQIACVGSFTPGKTIPAGSKDIYERDSYTITYDTNLPTGDEILLATVSRTGVAATLVDQRAINRVALSSLLNDFVNLNNPGFLSDNPNFTPTNGIVSVTHAVSDESRARGTKLRVQWGFKCEPAAWTNPAYNTIRMNTGSGGKYTAVTDVANDDFNGWYAIAYNGTNQAFRAKIVDTVDMTTYINLIVRDNNDKNITGELSTGTSTLYVVPNCDTIEFKIFDEDSGAEDDYYECNTIHSFDVALGHAWIPVRIPESKRVVVYYRHVKNGYSGPWKYIQNSSYYAEDQFTYPVCLQSGVTLTPYTNGLLDLKIKTNSTIINDGTTITFQNSYASYLTATYGTPRYYYDDHQGIVRLSGVVNAAAATSTTMFTVPAKLKPAASVYGTTFIAFLTGITAGYLNLISIDTSTGVATHLGTAGVGGGEARNVADQYFLNQICWIVEKDTYDAI